MMILLRKKDYDSRYRTTWAGAYPSFSHYMHEIPAIHKLRIKRTYNTIFILDEMQDIIIGSNDLPVPRVLSMVLRWWLVLSQNYGQIYLQVQKSFWILLLSCQDKNLPCILPKNIYHSNIIRIIFYSFWFLSWKEMSWLCHILQTKKMSLTDCCNSDGKSFEQQHYELY